MQELIGLKEWSAVVDALGTGKQTIIVRGYEPKVSKFFLYPTFSYFIDAEKNPDKFNEQIQSKHHIDAKKSGARTIQRGQKQLLVDVEYFAEIRKTFWLENEKAWKLLEPYYIWSGEHVSEYAQKTRVGGACLWLVRVYKLTEPVVLGRVNIGGPPSYHQYPETLDTENAVPVLSDNEYAESESNIQSMIKPFLKKQG